jgi:DNA-binding transcriptional LysR family regulator
MDAYCIDRRSWREALSLDNILRSMEQFEPNNGLIFARIAEAGSFSRAAEQLGLPQSTVSRRMTLFEERLGERLMRRTTRRLRLTEMLAAFIALHPAGALELDGSPRRVDLLGENFDIAVRLGALPDDARLAARRIAVFPIGLYAAPTDLAEQGDPLSPEDRMHHEALRLIERDGEAAGWTLLSGPQRWEGRPAGRTTANSPELLIRWACAGVGIAAAPDRFAAPRVRCGALRPVLPEWSLPSHPAWAVFPGRRLMSAKTRAFIEMLEAALTGVPGKTP